MCTSGATKWAPDVHWAEIRTLQKLLAPRPEKSKIRHEIDFKKKKNEPIPEGVAMSELSNGTKKHTSKSCETIPSSKTHYRHTVAEQEAHHFGGTGSAFKHKLFATPPIHISATNFICVKYSSKKIHGKCVHYFFLDHL
jgi:hypothetical protein